MRASWKTIGAFAFGAVMGLVAAGCQTYDFEPVEPISIARQDTEMKFWARNFKPNVMLLVDKSGSMDLPVDPADPDCKDSNGNLCGEGNNVVCNPAVCPTRWSELQSAMEQFLVGPSKSSDVLRLGMTTYPHPEEGGSCAPSKSVLLPVPMEEDSTALASYGATVWDRLNDIVMDGTGGSTSTGGGTPTALSLRYIRENVAELKDAERFNYIILLTDGLPNCNPEHAPYDPAKPEQCVCTLANNACSISGYERIGCLDSEGAVAEVQGLKAQNVTTIVVGFGAETADATKSGPRVLQAMAVAGGFERSCKVDADCGEGQTCDNGFCSQAFFQASNGAQLAEALRKISDGIKIENPCAFPLDTAPTNDDPKLISVRVNGEVTPATEADGTTVNWVYQAGTGGQKPAIVFEGAKCELIENSTRTSPVEISVRVVQSH